MSESGQEHRPTIEAPAPVRRSLVQPSNRFNHHRVRTVFKVSTSALSSNSTNELEINRPNSGYTQGVKYLQDLYGIVVGLAIALPFEHWVREQSEGSTLPDSSTILLFIAFLVTLVPFYHGSMRYLDMHYIEVEDSHLRGGALLVDYFLLFIQASFLFALSALLDHPEQYAWVFVVVLAIDALWGIIGRLVFFTKTGSPIKEFKLLFFPHRDNPLLELRWVVINVVTFSILVSYLLRIGDHSRDIVGFLVFVSIARTITDYALCWSSYFPRRRASSA